MVFESKKPDSLGKLKAGSLAESGSFIVRLLNPAITYSSIVYEWYHLK